MKARVGERDSHGGTGVPGAAGRAGGREAREEPTRWGAPWPPPGPARAVRLGPCPQGTEAIGERRRHRGFPRLRREHSVPEGPEGGREERARQGTAGGRGFEGVG
ncbi:hypothetical protein GCM10010387_16950 [Streptomyces inusitatus]|uniref:Uncharacterized protein n=1 Tax=Streptomyces inusitatus TaxID=68221 RepID=A0A918PXD3_9ACTN|nr:hypothetical protein GCM10010387_16950 [Streptomyces inusitatus]